MVGAKNLISLHSVVGLYRTLGADLYASLDLPPTPGDTRETRRRKWRITLSNFEFMLKELPGHRVIPIVHGHSLDELGQACTDIKRLIDRPTIISLGGMVPFLRGLMSGRRFHYRRANGAIASGHSFVADAISICRAEFPSSHLHVFGAVATTTAIALLALGAHSVDSLSWRRAAGYGTIFLSGSAERIISQKRRADESRPRINASNAAVLDQCGCPICIRHATIDGKIRELGESLHRACRSQRLDVTNGTNFVPASDREWNDCRLCNVEG